MKRYLIFIFFLLFAAYSSEAGPVLPARIGGSVTVNGIKLTHATSAGYVFRITGKDGKGFSPPAENKAGLNKKGIYIIDIPLYDPNSQPEGAKPKSTAVIHVLKNGVELQVVKPSLGEFTVGKGGSISTVDLVILSTGKGSAKEKP
ncbi:MAG: hypothetical protein PVG39_08435 [Desulfobacteraceae bacterium]